MASSQFLFELAAQFHLGEAQRQVGQLAQARLTWSDLARLIERAGAAPLPGNAQDVRALALAEIPTSLLVGQYAHTSEAMLRGREP